MEQDQNKNAVKTTGLTYGEALEAVKQDRLICRSGWNGKGMFVFMRPGDELEIGFIPNVKSLPDSFKEWVDKNLDDKTNPGEIGLTKIKFAPYLCMKAADNTIVNGWLASQTDMLSSDWEIL